MNQGNSQRFRHDDGVWQDGGLLLQTPDEIDAPGDDPAGWELKTGQPASADVLADLA